MKKPLSAALLVAFSAIGTTATAGVLNVPVYRQEHSMWCWAASARMILRYSKGVQYNQCNIVNDAFNINHACGNSPFYWNNPGNEGNWNDHVDDVMNAYWGGARFYQQQNGAIAYCSLQSRINASKPFVISWRWSSGGAHDVVVRGFSGDDVYFNGPWDGSQYVRTYAATVRVADRAWEDSIFQY